MKRQNTLSTIIVLLIVFTSIARADFIWAPTIYYGGILTWWIIVVGLVVEMPFYLLGYKLGIRKTVFATLFANLFSLLVGLMIWYPIVKADWFLESMLNVGGAIAGYIIIIGGPILTLYINVRLESFAVSKLFKVQIDPKNTRYMLYANILSFITTIIGVYYLFSNQQN